MRAIVGGGYRCRESQYGAAAQGQEGSVREQILHCQSIGYVCAHPEILFGAADRPHIAAGYLAYSYLSPTGWARTVAVPRRDCIRPNQPDDLVRRIAQAYRVLDQIYAPPACRLKTRPPEDPVS